MQPTLTPAADAKLRALRKMKLIATGAFVLMTVVFFLTNHLGSQPLFWVIRWDHINAFAEASMVGALADWFAVVALFRHPMGIPIWHTAIIPRKKDEIGRNLGNFVETRLLSVETLEKEISRFSAAKTIGEFLSGEENRTRAADWLADGLMAVLQAMDDDQVEQVLGNLVTGKLRELNAAGILGGGLKMITASGRHYELLDQALHKVAEWVPSRRETIHGFIERSMEKMLKWGSKLVPRAVVDRATDQTLTALIEILQEASSDPEHPLRVEFTHKVDEWIEKLKDDPDWIARVNQWKNDLVEHPELRKYTAGIWTGAKQWLADDLAKPDSAVRGYALRAVESFAKRLQNDPELAGVIDDRLRSAALAFISTHHHAIGGLIQRVIDSWNGEQLSRELELNLGKDLQYIRLNGTFIGGIVGVIIHVLR